MNRPFFASLLLLSSILFAGCSNESQNQISVSKLKSRNEYQSIAYKKEINHQNAEKLLKMLAQKKEKSQVIHEKKKKMPSYKLYFNTRSGNNKLIVHSIWLNGHEEAIVKQNSTYLKLSKKETAYMVGFLTGIE